MNFPNLYPTLLLSFSLLFFACGKSSRQSRGKVSGKPPLQGNTPLVLPLTPITDETPAEEKLAHCKDYIGLFKATCLNDISGVKKLIEYASNELVNGQSRNGWTSLMWASKNGQTPIVKLFLQHPGIDVNVQDKAGRTALMYAASESGREEIIELILLKPSIQFELKDFWKDTSLSLAYKSQSYTAVEGMLKKGAKVNDGHVFVNACEQDRKDYIQLFLQFGAQINELNNQGMSALVQASGRGHREVVRILLEKQGTNVNIIDRFTQSTPLIQASMNGHLSVVELLVQEFGLDLNFRRKDSGKTALGYAMEHPNNQKVIELLKSYGAES